MMCVMMGKPKSTVVIPGYYPSTQCSISITGVTRNLVTFGVTRGDGDSLLIVVKPTIAYTSDRILTDGVIYSGNLLYTTVTNSVIDGGKVVHAGATSITSFSISGLQANTLHYIRVYEYNSEGPKYLQTLGTNATLFRTSR